MQQIDIRAIYKLLLSRWKLLLLFAVIGAILLGCFAAFVLETKYATGVSMFVSSLTDAADSQTGGTTYSEMVSAEWLVLTYIRLLEDRSTMQEVQRELLQWRNVSVDELSNMISLYSISETAILRINVTADDPYFAAQVCNAMAKVAPRVLKERKIGGSVNVIGEAGVGGKVATKTSRMTVIGGILGLLAACVLVVVRYLTDNTVKTATALKERLQVPVLGVIPGFDQKAQTSHKTGGKKHA